MQAETYAFQKLLEMITILSGVTSLAVLALIGKEIAPTLLKKMFGWKSKEGNGSAVIAPLINADAEAMATLAQTAVRQTTILEGIQRTQEQQGIVLTRIDSNLQQAAGRQVTLDDLAQIMISIGGGKIRKRRKVKS